MANRIKLVDVYDIPTVKPTDPFDWKECLICQERTHEKLQCHAYTKRTDVDIGAGYYSFETIIQRCKAINWFPVKLNLQQLDEGNGIASTHQIYKAKWHQTYKNKFSDIKISRQDRKKQTSDVVGDSQSGHASKLTRRSCGYSTKTMMPGCFLW